MHSPPHKVAAEIDLSAEAIESRVEDLGSFLKLASSQVRSASPPLTHPPTTLILLAKKSVICVSNSKKNVPRLNPL